MNINSVVVNAGGAGAGAGGGAAAAGAVKAASKAAAGAGAGAGAGAKIAKVVEDTATGEEKVVVTDTQTGETTVSSSGTNDACTSYHKLTNIQCHCVVWTKPAINLVWNVTIILPYE